MNDIDSPFPIADSHGRLECKDLWGGIRNRDIEVSAGKVIGSIYSASSEGGQGGDIYYFGVCKGDKLFLKASSGPVCGTAVVSDVRRFEKLTPERMIELERRYNDLVCGRREYWQSKADCRFGVLVWLSEVRRMEPIRIVKKDWRAWVVLKKGADYGLLKRDF